MIGAHSIRNPCGFSRVTSRREFESTSSSLRFRNPTRCFLPAESRRKEILIHGEQNCRRYSIEHRSRCTTTARSGTAQSRTGDEQAAMTAPRRTAREETMEMLGWPALCDSVARFALTAMGKESCRELVPPVTQDESQALLDETSAALAAGTVFAGELDFGAIRTESVKNGVNRASKSLAMSGAELAAVATLLQIAQTLQRGVKTALVDRGIEVQEDLLPIVKIIEEMVVHDGHCKAIWSKIDDDGVVKDTASPQVRQARIQERSLEQRLQELLNKLVREKSGTENIQGVTDVDGRYCLIVSPGGGSSTPGLLFQQSSMSAYLEPSQAVPLNDKLAEARAEVQRAEHDVLVAITSRLVHDLDDIRFVLERVVRLDVIAARGRYSSWINGYKPIFVNSPEADNEIQGLLPLVSLRKARHPLLVEQHRQATKRAKAKFAEKSKILGRMRARISAAQTVASSPQATAVEEAEVELAAWAARAPVPIDVQVSSEKRVVAITGPNTGGKTAAIKAVGLAALMAKVGLYVPAMEPVYLPWFDGVFADIGDEQSLGQSLSTFSGHLMRIKRIMSEASNESLVLLDELGAGTDPAEGAALGMALLEYFAGGGALLTFATTHHGELKTLKYTDQRFENASVEFDEVNLAPTYKLLWGIPGRSNALNIASRLGLSESIVSVARNLYGAVSAELNEVIMKLEAAKLTFDQSRERSESLATEAKEFYSQVVASARRLFEHRYVLQSEKSEQLASAVAATNSQLRKMVTNKKSQRPPAQLDQKNPVVKVEEMKSKKNRRAEKSVPAVGQLVYVPKLGRECRVTNVNETRKEISVQAGFLQIDVALRDLQ